MQEHFLEIQSISDLHELYGCGKPKHPLISIIDLSAHEFNRPAVPINYNLGLYTIFCKKFSGELKYGRSYYDFSEGSLMFTAPGQVMGYTNGPHPDEGWGLFFHPDLLNSSDLGRKITTYSYFNYEANEALHISEDEKLILRDCLNKIEKEYSQNIDKHTQSLIQSNVELLLNYCSRFYDRQFYTRAKVNSDVVSQFESALKGYFANDSLIEVGIPNVKYFASRLNLSPNYLSDLLHKFTGKTTQEHIHLEIVEKAKNLLWSTQKSISEVAYDLGFEHPSHFTKIFKNKTGHSPSDYRQLN